MKLKYKETVDDVSAEYEFEGTLFEITELYVNLMRLDSPEQIDVKDRIKRALDEAIINSRRQGGALR